MGDLLSFTPSNPCRCGYDGTGTHQCHAGRALDDRCPNAGVPRLITVPVALAGMQFKMGATVGVYCLGCWVEAGFSEVPR